MLLNASQYLLIPDCFDVGEFADSVNAQLAADAGAFRTAEGNSWIGHHHAVDEHHARVNPINKLFLLVLVGCPCTGAKPEGRSVSDADRVMNIFGAEQGSYGTEKLVTSCR